MLSVKFEGHGIPDEPYSLPPLKGEGDREAVVGFSPQAASSHNDPSVGYADSSPYAGEPRTGAADSHTSDIGHWFGMTSRSVCYSSFERA